jgi:hypothetical protein
MAPRSLVGVLLVAMGAAACGGAAGSPGATPVRSSKPVSRAPREEPRETPKAPSLIDPEALLLALNEANVRPPRSNAPARPRVTPVPFRLDDLAIVRRSESAAPAAPPTSPLPGISAKELLIAEGAHPRSQKNFTATVSVRDALLGSVRIGPWAGSTGGAFGTNGGANVPCGDGSSSGAVRVPLHYESLRTVTGATASELELVIADGWFDRSECRATVITRTSVKPRPLVPGSLLFAFRLCAETCSERQSVVVIMPRAQAVVAAGSGGVARHETGAYTRVELPVRRGGGGSMMANIATGELASWNDVVGSAAGPKLEAPWRSSPPNAFVGLEIVQAAADEAPIGVAFVDPPEALSAHDSD